jgi:hypothetical protein
MKQRLGAILAIVLGTVLVAMGATEGSGATAGVPPVLCGSIPVIGGVTPVCPTGHIVITKDVNGDSAAAPASGWNFTITSTNCVIFPGSKDTVHIDAAGGTVSSDALYSTLFANANGDCAYTVTEDSAAGWTTTYSPTGALVLGSSQATGNDIDLTVTNTQIRTSTSGAPSTTTVTTTVPASTPASASPTDALANTGAKHVKPTLFAGIALIAFGVVMLFAGRRPRRASH